MARFYATPSLGFLLIIIFSFSSEAETTFEQALRQTGWSVERTQTGDFLLVPPTPNDLPRESTELIDLETLGEKLKATGWKVERDADGSLELYPQGVMDTDEPAEISSPIVPIDRWNVLKEVLRAAGWGADQDSDGSLILVPPGAGGERRTISEQPDSQAGSLLEMRQKLRETGWAVTENNDGSILLYPPGHEKTASNLQPDQSFAAGASIEPTVTTVDQARRLAQIWLEQQPNDDLAVGKIRKIFNFYAVSIVTGDPPYRLQNQIFIQESDGQINTLR